MAADHDARTLDLVAGGARVTLVPALGAAIAGFTWRDAPVLRPTPAAALSDGNVRHTSCYPLVPYSNRIRNAELAFAGATFRLARNFGAHPHAIHGVGWQRAWHVEEAGAHKARLAFEHTAANDGALAWPWPFRAAQTFELSASDEGGHDACLLQVTLTLESRAGTPFPFGLGWHPFFPKSGATELAFDAGAVWENDATQLPARRTALPPQWRFARGRALRDLTLDNVFTGWAGTATLHASDERTRTTLRADRACRFLVVYAPPGAAFVAIEPVTHETDAFNRAANGSVETGMRTLPPGGAFSCTMRIAARCL